jgi:hypothetical protein
MWTDGISDLDYYGYDEEPDEDPEVCPECDANLDAGMACEEWCCAARLVDEGEMNDDDTVRDAA